VRSPRTARAQQRGFTLVEALVSLALLAVMGVALGLVTNLGFRTLMAPGAASDRFAAVSGQMALAELLPLDVHQATCLEVPQLSLVPSGNCGPLFATRCSPSALLCTEAFDPQSAECRLAVYVSSPANGVSRTVWANGSQQTVQVAASPVRVRASIANPSGSWFGELDLSIASVAPSLSNPPTTVLELQPLSTNPGLAQVGASSSC
jgi:prepilin-type N-terminal cleavage/methylation domain-containing protein